MKGCVLIHGFTGDPYEVQPLADHFRQYGWKISTPCLAGHGDSDKDLKDVVWSDWIHSAEQAVKEICETCDTVYLVGFSMGGLIAAHLSTKYPVERLILLSPSVFYINPRQLFKDVAEIIKNNFSSFSGKDTFKRYMDKVSRTPLRAVAHFQRLVRVLKPRLRKVNVPTLIIQGECDDLVDPKSATYVYEQISSKEKELHFLPESRHIICHDRDKEKVIELADRFFNLNKVQQ